MQFYSVQTKESVEVAEDQIEYVTMSNGRKAAKANVEKDGKTLKLFKFLPSDSAAKAPAAGAESGAKAAAKKSGAKAGAKK